MNIRRGILAISLLLASTVAAGPACATTRIVVGPLVQMPSVGKIVIAWETDVPTSGKVMYGTGGVLDQIGNSSVVAKRHEVTLEQIVEGSEVSYRVLGGTVQSPVHSFIAPPGAGETVKVLVLGDTRSTHVHHLAVVEQAMTHPVHALINTGDLVNRGDCTSDWRTFFEVENELLASTVSYHVVGNHDRVGGGTKAFTGYFVQPTSPHAPEQDFYIDLGVARFVILDNAVTASDPVVQKEWLDAVLEEGAGSASIAHQFVVIHQGLHSNGPHGPSKSLLKAGLDDVMRAHGVEMVIAGHDHIYERGQIDGLRYMVSGGGGAPVYGKKIDRGHAQVHEVARHFVVFTISAEKVEFTTLLKDGSVLESCSLVSTAGGFSCH